MNESVRQLQPAALWNHFADLNAIPRASKKEERVIAFMKSFGESLNLPVTVDQVGNIIIKKPATAGMEDRQTVCLQSHVDMVHQKNADTDFDFDTQGIEMYVENDWVRAKGTTLGADNGIGVATIMSLLASSDIPHPSLDALFTIDEETGMTGAMGLQGGLLDASILLNLDTEEDHELTIGCAGGVDVTAGGEYDQVPTAADMVAFKVSVKGLSGGHSGMDIHRGRGNANKLMNRLLDQVIEKCHASLSSLDGGSLRNAIPRESQAVVTVPLDQADRFRQVVQELSAVFYAEYHRTDPQINISASSCALPESVVDPSFAKLFVQLLAACPNGIYRMSPEIDGLVQTSNNVARVWIKDGAYGIQCLTRSSVDSEKMDLARTIGSTFSLLGATITQGGAYPGWTPNPDAAIVRIMSELYEKLHAGQKPLVNACHAGLECGILGTNYPAMEMISFGPTITGAHSPDEKVSVSSVQKFWHYLLETLKAIPAKA